MYRLHINNNKILIVDENLKFKYKNIKGLQWVATHLDIALWFENKKKTVTFS